MNKGKPVMDLLGEMNTAIAAAKATAGLEAFAARVEKAVNKLGEVGMYMGATAMSPKVMSAFAAAHPFLEVTGDVVMAWMLLWRATIAASQLAQAKKKDAAFYEGQIKSADYFINAILPITTGKMIAILNGCSAAVEISEDAFGGK
jgi:hypothetical protein